MALFSSPFQGGEPTLAGLNFFRRFMELEAQCRTKDIGVGHAIQTNGLHINEEWAAFSEQHDFLVGVSIDGNQTIHDTFRVDAAGKGTWDQVTQTLALLDRCGSEKYSLKPEAYGKFLCGLFDCWYRDRKAGNYISIRTFDDYCASFKTFFGYALPRLQEIARAARR